MNFIKWHNFFALIALIFTLGSCKINSNMMFKTPKDGSFKYDSIPLRPVTDYRISIDDKITFTLNTNKGKNLLEALTGTISEGTRLSTTNNTILYGINEYIVRSDGKVELPILGDVQVQGLTIRACQDSLESMFKNQYQDPFVQVKVTNQRCIIFPGNGSSASIIPITNNNTTLMEIIAQTGGIPSRGQSKVIKVMRKVNDKREIYHIDISTIEGLKYADMIIQGNDYIYIEPRPLIVNGLLTEWAPISSLLTTILLTYTIINKYK
jgi:polysaccharide export outer membrane protein